MDNLFLQKINSSNDPLHRAIYADYLEETGDLASDLWRQSNEVIGSNYEHGSGFGAGFGFGSGSGYGFGYGFGYGAGHVLGFRYIG